MSLIWMDGFDYYSTTIPFNTRYPTTGFPTFGVAGRFGGLCLRTPQNVSISVPAGDTFCVGFAIRAGSLSSLDQPIVTFRSSVSLNQAILSNNSSGNLKFWRGNMSAQLGSASGHAFSGTDWHYVEVVFTRNASAGAAQVFIDGVLVIDLSAVNTGSASIDIINILPGGSQSCDLDDLYITDTAVRVGERRIETLVPTSDASTQWTPDTGTDNFARVDETQSDGDTSYVSTTTPGSADLYGIGSLSETPATIDAVQVTNIARKTDANSHTMRGNIKSGATVGNGTAKAVPSSYGILADIFELDPDGSVAWDAAAVNAAQIGPELVA